MNDAELLRKYACNHSEQAFQDLVQRHLPLVYSAALRQVRNSAMADDVAQVVFILLSRKAGKLSPGTILSGWLYRTTYFVASKAVRGEWRRHILEQKAVEMQIDESDDSTWQHVAPVLDAAMAQLGEADRAAVLLRYFQNQSLRQVGDAFGISEDTAQKRVSRALEKLRGFLGKRGVALSLATVGSILSARAVEAAPAHLGGMLALTALSGKPVPASMQMLLQAFLRALLWQKALAVAASVVMLLGMAGLAVHFTRQNSSSRIHPGIARVTVPFRGNPNGFVPGPATVKFQFRGNPAATYQLRYSADDAVEQTSEGPIPGEVVFQADGFTATMTGHGPGPFGYDVFLNDLRVAYSDLPETASNFSITLSHLKGKKGIRVSLNKSP